MAASSTAASSSLEGFAALALGVVCGVAAIAGLVAGIAWYVRPLIGTGGQFRRVPGGNAIVGHVGLLWRDIGRYVDVLEDLARSYGTCEFRMWNQRFCVVADAEAVAAIQRLRPLKVANSTPIRRSMDSAAPGLFSAELPLWGAERRVVAPAFAHANLASYAPSILDASRRFAESLLRADGRPVAVNEPSQRFAADLIANLTLGAHRLSDEERSKFSLADVAALLDTLGTRLLAPVPYFRVPFLGPRLDGGRAPVRRLQRAVQRVVDAATGSGATIVDKFVALNRAQASSSSTKGHHDASASSGSSGSSSSNVTLSVERLAGNVLTLFVAGTDTTAHTLTWMLFALSQDARLQARLRDEARGASRVYYAAAATGRASFETILEAHPATRSLFYEVLRIYTPAPFIVVENTAEIEVLGRRVRPREYAFVLPYRFLAMTATNLPGDAPASAFEPLRWLDEDGPTLRPIPLNVQPFGAGLRICPGRDLAQLETVLCTAEVLRRYRLRFCDDHRGPHRTVFAFTSRPDRDIRISFDPITSASSA